MQRLFHSSPEGAELVDVPTDAFQACRDAGGWIWLDVTAPTSEDVALLGDRFGFDSLSLQDVLDVTLLPKVEDHGDYLFVVLHGLVTGGQERLATTELDMFIGPDFLVTAHPKSVAGIDWIIGNAAARERLARTGAAGLAAAIAEAEGRQYLPLLDHLDERIEELEDLAVAADPRTLGGSQALRRDVIVLRRVLGPQRDVIYRLSQSPSTVIGEGARRSFLDVYDHQFRLVESLDAARSLLAAVLETYHGAVSERTNEVMKVLTVFSAILLPLALVTGMWGMNFRSLPGADWRWGFGALVFVMAVIAAGLWMYFVRRGFIGGRRLRDLPRAVGLGHGQDGPGMGRDPDRADETPPPPGGAPAP